MAQASIEIFGGLASVMFVVILFMNRNKRKSIDQFKWMFGTVALTFFFEAAAYIFRGNVDIFSVAMTRIANFAVFLFNIVLANVFVGYVYLLLKEKGCDPGRIYRRIAQVCFGLVSVILVVNIFTGWMYYFDEANYYHRNDVWYIYTVLNLICIFTGCIAAVRNRKLLGKATIGSVIAYVIVPILAIVLQSYFYGIAISTLGVALSLLILFISYLIDWSKEEYDDMEMGQKSNRTAAVLILFIIMVIIMSASIISCIVSLRRISSANSESNSQIIAHMVSESIDNEFIRPITAAQTMANDHQLKQLLIQSGDSSAKSVEEEAAQYLCSIRDGFGYQMVYAVGEQSKAYFTYDGIGKFIDVDHDPHDIWYKDTLDSGKDYVLNVDTDEVNNWDLSVFVNKKVFAPDDTLLGVCGIGVDMRKLQKILADYEAKYDIKIDLINREGLIQVDSDGERIEAVSLEKGYLDKAGADDFYHEDLGMTSRLTKYMPDLDWYLVVEDLDPDKINIMEITLPSILIFFGGLVLMGMVFGVISMREQKTAKELEARKKASLTDEMTGLYNRRAYEEDCERIKKEEDLSSYIIIMLDVNGLKFANDNLGHAAGDELLIGSANCMVTTFGGHGKVYRVGGDEFVVLMKGNRERLDDSFKTFDHVTGNWKGQLISELSISKGAAVCSEHKDLTFEEIRELADKRMYADKDEYYRRTGKERRK